MTARRRSLPVALPVAMLLAVLVIAGCSSAPVSQAGRSPTSGPTAMPATPAPSEPAPSTPTPAATPGAPAPTPDGPPPKPGNPTFELVKQTPHEDGSITEDYEITWTSPAGQASSFLVYGVTECLRYARKYDGKPCVVRGMRIAKDQLVLLATVPGEARSATISWEGGEAGPPPYAAILVRATNDLGDSIFTIVHSETVCWGCVY